MKKLLGVFLLAALIITNTYSEPSSAQYEELNEKLFGHLDFLNTKFQKNRYLSGGLLIGIGVVSAAAGFLVYTTPSSDPEISEIISYGLIGAGAVYTGIGVPYLLIPTKEEKLFSKFISLPEETEKEIKSKIEKGEREFRELSDSRQQSRILGGGTGLALGVGSLFFTDIYNGALLIGSSLAILLVEGPTEKEWKIYIEDKEMILR
jgi:hypothetical protein